MMYLLDFVKALKRISKNNVSSVSSHIRSGLGLKSINSSAPQINGSRTTELRDHHTPFGVTKYYTNKSFNAITCHINSEEFAEDKATLNKKVDTKIITIVSKNIPDHHTIVHHGNYIKKGELISEGYEPFDEIRANISGEIEISSRIVRIQKEEPIGNGTKIQNIFLSKHTLVEEYGRFIFVDPKEHPIKEETIENIKSTNLKPEIIDMTKYKAPTIVTGSKSVFKRRAAGHIAQLTLGLRMYILGKNDWKTENDWDLTIYLTKVYDKWNNRHHDAIVGIGCWLISINSGGYEYKIGQNDYDIIGRSINSATVDQFGYKVMKYSYPELADALLEFQLKKREEKVREYLERIDETGDRDGYI